MVSNSEVRGSNSRPWSTRVVLGLLLLCILQVGISLIWFDSGQINQDSFGYVSIANYYLFAPTIHIRDAFTVGPVIPALVALAKVVTLKFVQWSPDVDIAILKSMTFLCYLVIALSAYRILTRHIDRKMAFVALFFLFGLLGGVQDTLSLNGELIAVVLLSVLMAILGDENRGGLRLMSVAFLSVCIIYTKMQAIPLLMLLLASETNSKKELRLILLYVFSVGCVAELLLYLNGAGLLRNLAHLYVYAFKKTALGQSSQVMNDGLFSAVTNYGVHLAYMMWLAARHFSFVYVVVLLLLLGKPGPGKNLLSDWKVWLGVTIFTILAPNRPYEHYLLFVLPFVLRFAGPAVAGIKGTSISPKHWRYVQAGMAAFLVLELFHSVQTLNPYRWNWAGASQKFTLGQDMANVKAMINRNPGSVLVNGWDYRVYSYLNSYSSLAEYPLMTAGAITEPEYIESMVNNHYDYLIDTMDYYSVLSYKKYALNSQGMEAAVVARYYDLAYDQGNLRVYKRKAGQPPANVSLSGPRPIAFSVVNVSSGCKDCLAEAPPAGAGNPGVLTMAPGTATGDFVASFVPQDSITQIRYSLVSVFQTPQGMSIDAYNDCADGRRIKRSIDLKDAKNNGENEAYLDNEVCSSRRIELHFKNEGAGHGQWLDLLGVNGY